MTLQEYPCNLYFMPITKSAAKRMRQNLKAQRRNTRVKRAMKSDIKAVMRAITESDKSVADKLKSAQSNIDKAVKAGIIHKNNASRKKSQLVRAAKTVVKPTKVAKTAETSTKKKPASKTDSAKK